MPPTAALASAACMWANTTFLPTDEVTACINALPFNETWRDGAVKTLRELLPNYVLLDSLTSTGPPANIKVDLLREVGDIAVTTYESDADMQSAFAKLFLKTHDAHTVYVKPGAYTNLYYSQPFTLSTMAVGAAQKFYLGDEQIPGILDELGGDYKSLAGLEVVSIDGVDPVTAITEFGDKNIFMSQDQGTRFNSALTRGYFTRRDIRFHDVPVSPLEYVLRDPNDHSGMQMVRLPWTAAPRKVDAPVDVTVEACLPTDSLQSSIHRVARDPMRIDSEATPAMPSAARWTKEFDVSPFAVYISGDNSTAVFKLSSFSPDNFTAACDDIQQAFNVIKVSGATHLVVDVLGNGGGWVCLGYNFLELLVPELLGASPKLVQGTYDLPWVPSVSKALQESADSREAFLTEFLLADTLEPMTKAVDYDEGASYLRGTNPDARRSKRFYMDCGADACDMSPPAVTFSKDNILVLSDGTCGSTCATFMHRLQAGRLAKVAGVGGIKYMPMSSSSFAGGFTSTLENLNTALLKEDQIPAYPFNGGLNHFAQGEFYDYLRNSTPAQYAWTSPDFRLDFWDFNGDLGKLYDMAQSTFHHDGTCDNVAWGQCGGRSHDGLTCCHAGYACQVVNDWFSQCQPESSDLAV